MKNMRNFAAEFNRKNMCPVVADLQSATSFYQDLQSVNTGN